MAAQDRDDKFSGLVDHDDCRIHGLIPHKRRDGPHGDAGGADINEGISL